MAHEKESVVSKIAALLNKTTDQGCSEEEAASAAAMAQKLLFKYKLEMADIESAGGEKTESVGQSDFEYKTKAHDGDWKLQFLFELSRYNFCKTIARQGWGNPFIIGKSAEVEVVKALHSWISEQLETICKDRIKEGYNGPDRIPTFRRSFFTSAVYTISRRLREQQREMKEESEKGNTLIVVTGTELREYIERKVGPLTHGRGGGGSSGSLAGGVAGAIAGRQVDISRPSKRLNPR